MTHRHILTTAAATATLLALITGTAAAATAPATASAQLRSSKRICAVAAAGFAACQARVVTNGWVLHPMATTGPTGYTPAQLRKVYGVAGFTSTAKIAIVDAYAHPNAAADLAVYRQQFGLGTANLTQVNQSGGTTLPGGDTGWGQEEMLDLEMASAICPACSILYVGANSASFNDLAAAVNTAAGQGAKVISNSYGGREFATETSLAAAYSHPGVAITVSSGDSAYGAQAPAAFNTVTAVGGTTLKLKADGTRNTETVWSGAGSGCSAYIGKPSFQSANGVTACSNKRAIADVSAVADPATGVAVYDTYGSTGGLNWYVFGGTSVAAPIVGAIYALGSTAGVPTANAYASRSSLFDVTSGSNGRCNRVGAVVCTAGPGWDGPSGNGTPNGNLAPF